MYISSTQIQYHIDDICTYTYLHTLYTLTMSQIYVNNHVYNCTHIYIHIYICVDSCLELMSTQLSQHVTADLSDLCSGQPTP